MLVWLRWLFCAYVIEAVRFNDRLLAKKPMKEFGQVVDLKNLNNKRQFIPGISDWSDRPLVRGEFGPVATLRNIQESDTDARAAVQGLTSYDGDIVTPHSQPRPGGYQMALDADKMPDEDERGHGPLFDLFRKDSSHVHRDAEITRKKEKEELVRKEKEELVRKEKEELVRKEKEQLVRKEKEELVRKEKEELVRKEKEELVRKEIEEKLKRKQEEERKLSQEMSKKQNVENNDKNSQKRIEVARENSYVCYLPKIVVKTRLIGTTVVNEVKVYGDPRNEQSVHKFISTHVVSANTSELVNEFILPPQFILGVSPDIQKSNDISIANAAIYTKNGQLDLSQSPAKPQSQPRPAPVVQRQPNYIYVPRRPPPTRPPIYGNTIPTFNPFLPTRERRTTTTSTTTTTTKKPEEWTGDIISDIIQKKSEVKNKANEAREMLAWLNNAARHRKASIDVPAGDSNAYTGYEMVPASYLI